MAFEGQGERERERERERKRERGMKLIRNETLQKRFRNIRKQL